VNEKTRSTTLLLIAVALAGYGVYVASYVLVSLFGPASAKASPRGGWLV